MSNYIERIHINNGSLGDGGFRQGFLVVQAIYQLSQEIRDNPKIEEVKARIKIKLDEEIEDYFQHLVEEGTLDKELYQEGIVALTEAAIRDYVSYFKDIELFRDIELLD